jgi:hypothetical protein
MTEIGKINKPDVEQYKNKKKIYYVKNLYLPQNATDEYKKIFDRYWSEVGEHLGKLEAAGKVSRIYCESIYMTGEESMQVLKSMNTYLEKIVKQKMDAGGEFLPIEDKELFGAYVDWNNCLMIVKTESVYELVHKHLKEAFENRFGYIQAILKESIADGEAALLIMRDGDHKFLDLPDDIELFIINPPAYDDLIQFIRDAHEGKEFWRS